MTETSERRWGILRMSDALLNHPAYCIPGALPVGHRIIADRRDIALQSTDLLVEGPDMPKAACVDPPMISLVFEWVTEDNECLLWARWDHLHGKRWCVGTRPQA